MEERQWPGNARWQSSQVGKRKVEGRGPGALWQRNELELKLGIHRPQGSRGSPGSQAQGQDQEEVDLMWDPSLPLF